MEPIGNNPLVESHQPWNGWAQSSPLQPYGVPPQIVGDRLTPSGFGSGTFAGFSGPAADGAGNTSFGGGVFSQFFGFAQNVLGALSGLMQQCTGQNGSAAESANGQPCANGPCGLTGLFNGKQGMGDPYGPDPNSRLPKWDNAPPEIDHFPKEWAE